ncbi:hypothetical protein K456DRAFT_1932526 [Colletotrichum gloeosporioides 23]|nr:hypothetical protein K456DRAFT_1932526 [Colletotrichum gloeosporioides 23]
MESQLLPTASHTSECHGNGRENRSLPCYMLGLPGFASTLGIPMVVTNAVAPPNYSSSVPISNMKRSLTSRPSHDMGAHLTLTRVETESMSTVSQTQWECRKEVIRALYLTQNLPLKQIKVTMARTYSFCAT